MRYHICTCETVNSLKYPRIIRGVNNLGIEANCDWAVPKPIAW